MYWKLTMLKVVTLDFWGTLYQNAYAREERLHLLQKTLARYGQSHSLEELDEAYQHARSVWDRVWQSEQRSISIERWMREILDFIDSDLPGDVKIELGRAIQEVYLLGDTPRPVPGAIDVVPRLADRYRLGLISDTGLTPGRVLRMIMGRDGLLHPFDALTFSDEIGAAKPQPEPFLHTLERLDAQPEEAVHIGDLLETDLHGARGVGMRTILFLGVSKREDGLPHADGAFGAYDELEELLERLE